jgi:hypothetical protein
MCFAQKNQPAEALRFIRQARSINKENTDYMFREALVHALAKRRTECIASLQAALQNGYSVRMAQVDPELKEVRSTPEFQAVIQALPKRSGR